MARFGDKQAESLIGHVLRAGTVLSCIVTVTGLGLFLAKHAGEIPDYRVFHTTDASMLNPARLFPAMAHGSAVAIIEAGILLLIATPVARVAFLVGAFGLERDKLYVGVSTLVLLILLYSIFFFR